MDAYFAAFPNDFDTLGEVFVKTYYEQLQLNRNNVVDMYHASSLSSFDISFARIWL